MRKTATLLMFLLLTGLVAGHSGEDHSESQSVQQHEDSGVWNSLSGAYPPQTMGIVLVEIVVVTALVILAVRHRLQLRSK